MGRILLFYKYVEIQYPGAVAKWHLKRCKELGLTGRVIIAHEGINGTLGGSFENTQMYIDELTQDPRFQGIDFKEAEGDQTCFPRLRIVVKNEIVNLGLDPEKVKAEASFIDDLGADSLDIVELVMAMEEEFDLEIPDEDAEKLKTVNDVQSYLTGKGKV